MGALDGRRVLEFASERGAYCGKLFADMGADVILVTPRGAAGGRASGDLRDRYHNAGKRRLEVDLADAGDRQNLRRLAAAADIAVEAYPPGRLAALALGYAALAADHPQIVVVSITSFGQSGPYRDFAATDLIANAMGGAMYVTGAAEDPPVNLAGAQADVMASTCAAASALIALAHADRTGRGQHVDISAQEVVAAVCHIAGTGKWLDDGIVPRRMGSGLFASIPSGAYQCRDGLIYLMVNRPAHWQALAQWIHEETGEAAVLDALFSGPSANRLPHRDLIDHFVTSLTSRYEVEALYHAGQARHLSFTPVRRITEVLGDAHLAARDYFVGIEGEYATSPSWPSPPYRFSATPARLAAHNGAAVASAGDSPTWRARVAPPTARPDETAAAPLSGVRVVEFTAGMAGPWIGRFLAYHGADVIKVESAARPDVTRQYIEPRRPERGVQSCLSPWLTDWNAGKRCVALDLTRPAAVELAVRLTATADVVIENYACGTMEKLGLGHARLCAANPRLVMLSTSGFGDSGPCSRYISWGPNLEALSGFSALTGFPHRDCTMTQYAYPDALSALHGLFAVLAALDHRRRGGPGQYINLSQLEATIAVIGEAFLATGASGAEPRKLGNASPVDAPHGCYRCAGDDRWLAVAVSGDEQWTSLCKAMEDHQLGAAPHLGTAAGRLAARAEIDAAVAAWTAQRDAHAAMLHLQAAGVPAGVVQTARDKFEDDPHLRARGFHETIRHEVRGTVIADGVPTGLTATPGRTAFAGRAMGADNRAVFVDLLGLASEEYERLVAAGAIETGA